LKFTSNWKTIPKDANLINLAVAPKANDHKNKVRETGVHKTQFMNKKGKSVTKHADVPNRITRAIFKNY